MILTFSQKIDAFFSVNSFYEAGAGAQINGEFVPFFPTLPSFFGAIGPAISSLDFTTFNTFTDNRSQISLPDIVVVQAVRIVDEPAALAYFLAAAALIVAARFWRPSAR
jgi:hypothetical protein